ncbi:MAG: prepilin-type N-terminal cleavage/methylation domain-containing protein [Azonexus sp.]|jgi:prepilin-type N-terminal cleavage/methylation domain-containing protein|uniref:prepilin-type N-terminal cleavage/methylation domain-containing protein n=1 Tax=Azonexus sp. TaxID=1872668 RepID=UPI002820D34A|nr:prepilin-type N-terminal cleavage/methylation domain-containing protein [Azonexus sp.]MDR0775682.1 prepilin-type N-terminal cleavage/methylation domain-containing protein [Azonexus sp.]
MKSRQTGFTLVEIAIVLVIIGLLLGGVLKGQELINSAKVKNLANDFRTIPIYIYGYQDRFRALPGDDKDVVAHLGTDATLATASSGGKVGNGVIEGTWNSETPTNESYLFWQHVRLAGFAPGPTVAGSDNYLPKNAEGGRIGVTGANNRPITNLRGTYFICSEGISGRFAKQLDLMMDDGNTATGSMMTSDGGTSAIPNTGITGTEDTPGTAGIDDGLTYTVCMGV